MAEHLSVGHVTWTFVGRLEGSRARLCMDCAGRRTCICFDWLAAQFGCLDKLADCRCLIAGFLCSRADSPAACPIYHHPGLAAVLSVCHPADRGFEFHPFS